MNKWLTVLLCLFFIAQHTFAQQTPFESNVSNVGTTAAAFLNIGVGSRANAMGGAFVAISDDATALYWNPAGMSQCAHPEITLNHTDWFLDIYHEFVGAVIPAGRHAFGLSVTYLGVPDQKVRTIAQPEGNGNFYNASDLTLGVSYAFQFTDQFSMGATGKFIRQQIYNSSGVAGAVDLGALYQPSSIKWLSLGMQVANFGSSLRLSGRDVAIKVDNDPKHNSNERLPAKLDTDPFSLPLTFRFGLAIRPVNTRHNRFVTAIDLIHPSNNTESVNLGIIGGHIYGGGLTSYPLAISKGKEVWMTEHLVVDTDWLGALITAKEINDCMNAGMSAYLWWYIRRFYGPIDDNSNVTKRGYVMSQYARFVRPGFTRVSATENPQEPVYVTAYKNGSKVVIVALNYASPSIDQTFIIRNGSVTTFTPYVTSSTKNCLQKGDIAVSKGSFTATLDGESVTTFVSN